jgi:hypothetical protein
VARSTFAALPRSVNANGKAQATLTATLRDANGLAISGHKVTLRPLSGSAHLSQLSATSNAAGQARFTVKDALAQSVTFVATDATKHLALRTRATVTFGAAASAATSAITLHSAPRSSCPGGSARATVVVTLRSSRGAILSGRLVTLSFSKASRATAAPTSALTAGNGAASFTISDKTAQAVTVVAHDVPDSLTLAKSLLLHFPAARRC